MTPEDRALIVRRLRQEADRIEAGGEPRECVARGEVVDWCDGEVVDGAREAAETGLMIEREAAAGDYWSDEVDGIRWGVVVTIEEARVVTKACPTGSGSDADEVWDYGLIDAGAPAVEPPLDPCEDGFDCQACRPRCRECGERDDELIDEHDVCPACLAGEEDEEP